MGGFKRLCLAVWSLAGVFTLAALGLTWAGPWTDVASALMVINGYWMALEVCFCITAAGLVVTLLRALFSRRVKTVEVTTVDGGVISVTRAAIASQASHIVEADGSCAAARVSVSAKPRGHVRVHVRVLPHESVDVVEKGAQLHEELLPGPCRRLRRQARGREPGVRGAGGRHHRRPGGPCRVRGRRGRGRRRRRGRHCRRCRRARRG